MAWKIKENWRSALKRIQPATKMTATFRGLTLFFLLFTSLVQVASAQSPSLRPVELKCDSLVTPLGIDSKNPMLSWQLQDARIGARQTAYQMQIASSTELLTAGKPDIWDSSRVESDQSAGVSYGGPALVPEKRYFWRVRVWDKDGKPYPESDVSWWETGLMDAREWRGKWIPR